MWPQPYNVGMALVKQVHQFNSYCVPGIVLGAGDRS